MSVFNSEMLRKKTSITLTDAQMGLINAVSFADDDLINRSIKSHVRTIYAHMVSGQHPQWRGKRPCEITVCVYAPINDTHSRELNNARAEQGWGIRTVAGGTAAAVTRSKLVGIAAGAAAGKYALKKMRSWDEGDILITFHARVSGGIGPQSRRESLVIKESEYEGS